MYLCSAQFLLLVPLAQQTPPQGSVPSQLLGILLEPVQAHLLLGSVPVPPLCWAYLLCGAWAPHACSDGAYQGHCIFLLWALADRPMPTARCKAPAPSPMLAQRALHVENEIMNHLSLSLVISEAGSSSLVHFIAPLGSSRSWSWKRISKEFSSNRGCYGGWGLKKGLGPGARQEVKIRHHQGHDRPYVQTAQ